MKGRAVCGIQLEFFCFQNIRICSTDVRIFRQFPVFCKASEYRFRKLSAFYYTDVQSIEL